MEKTHHYALTMNWRGNTGTGTSAYRAYARDYSYQCEGKPEIQGSADPAFRGDRTKYNPEELLLAALSACHMLSYLHVCAEAGIIVTSYMDQATGKMQVTDGGRKGKFEEVTLNPLVTITDHLRIEDANRLHGKANEMCFIESSVNFPVLHRPNSIVSDAIEKEG